MCSSVKWISLGYLKPMPPYGIHLPVHIIMKPYLTADVWEEQQHNLYPKILRFGDMNLFLSFNFSKAHLLSYMKHYHFLFNASIQVHSCFLLVFISLVNMTPLFFIGALIGIHYTCLNYLNWFPLIQIQSSIETTSSFLEMYSFIIS